MRGAICRVGCRYWRGWSLSQCGRARLSSCKLLSVALCVVQLLSLAECLLALYIDLGVGFGILMCRNLVLRSRGNRERVLCVFQVAGLRGGRVEADQRARVAKFFKSGFITNLGNQNLCKGIKTCGEGWFVSRQLPDFHRFQGQTVM